MKRVLVFDSGVGGLSVLDSIAAHGGAVELDYLADNAWLPYGLKSDAELTARIPALVQRVAAQFQSDAVVLACNTASTIALDQTRAALSVPVIGVVPPIKPAAAATKTGVIGLLATPATVRRVYTNDLIANFAADKRVVRYGTSALVDAAEAKLRGETPDFAATLEALTGLFGAPGGGEIDVVALACTHFPLMKEELSAAAPRPCLWLDSGEAIARRLANVLILPTGQAQKRRAALTDTSNLRAYERAFRTRGFSAFSRIAPAPSFAAEPITDIAIA
ncbi:MAG: glutamate racemase [Alphaproteobacteria bacterium]